MEPLLQSIKKYLHEILRVDIEVQQWKGQGELPFFLADAYDFYETSLFNQVCLLMIGHESAEITPATIRKHQEQIQKNWKGFIIYAQASLSSYNRKRLIEQHVPFIIPGNQMYLPQYGLDLREHFRKIHIKKGNGFSPSTQTVVIYGLLRKTHEKLTPSLLAKKLGYSLMTMTRALNELKAVKIGEFHREGRECFWTFQDKSTLWAQAKSFLRNPIKKRIWVKNHTLKVSAGLSALSHFSQLSPPILPVFAIGTSGWEDKGVPSSEGASAEIEIWNYDPELFAKDGFVDPISLYCSLQANKDERIEMCLEEMMEKIKW
ncbi:MAG TPA: hypothetical protein VGJ00_00175 [Rhabdochlamydiaceae bacterium]